MFDHGRIRFAQLLFAAWLVVVAAACSSGPRLKRSVEVQAGQRTVVRLLDVRGTLALSLRNASAQETTAVYTPNSHDIDPGAKVVDDANLQTLLDVFSEKGLFERALADVPADARDALVVEQGQRRWIFARRQLGLQQAEQSFHEARAEFLALYNSSVAYHGTGEARPNFRAENARAQTDAQKAKTNLEKKSGEPKRNPR